MPASITRKSTVAAADDNTQFTVNSTGNKTCTLGTNGPSTGTTPYTWIKAKSQDGSVVYIPAWK
jgi:hypothetical protein